MVLTTAADRGPRSSPKFMACRTNSRSSSSPSAAARSTHFAKDVACESLRALKPSAWNSLGPQSVLFSWLRDGVALQACAKPAPKHREHRSKPGIAAQRVHRYRVPRSDFDGGESLPRKWPHPSHQKPSCSSSGSPLSCGPRSNLTLTRRTLFGFTSPSSRTPTLSSAVAHWTTVPRLRLSVSACKPCNTTRVPTA